MAIVKDNRRASRCSTIMKCKRSGVFVASTKCVWLHSTAYYDGIMYAHCFEAPIIPKAMLPYCACPSTLTVMNTNEPQSSIYS